MTLTLSSGNTIIVGDDFAESLDGDVRIMICDGDITIDAWMTPEELRIMSEHFNRLLKHL